MFTGVYAARRELIEHLETPGRRELVRDLIGPLLPSGAVRGLVEKGLWEDLGCPAGYLGASMRGLARMAEGGMAVPAGSRLENLSGCPVLIHETARVHPSTVFTGPTVLGEGTVIEGKTRVGSAVFMPDTRLEAGRCIERAILSPWGNAMIGRGASIPDAEP
jgi:NDP-sugar pyrophosphorylase family protein